ncbi:MAG: sugar transferase [Rhizobiaceae bacterium]
MRIFDILICLFASVILLPIALCVWLLVRVTSNGPALYWSDRVGQNNQVFAMPKFRTMRVDTPVVATHELDDPAKWLTPVGSFLRRSSLDEIPQLWCIVKGDMALVGPRPALFNQDDLIALRTERGIQKLRPGLTGWAQINGRDSLSIADKVSFDLVYLQQRSIVMDIKIIFLTALKIVKRDGVSH